MTNADRQASLQAFTRSTAVTLGAGLLVFLGTVLQLCELGNGRFGTGNLWPLSVIVGNIWDMLEICLKTPALEQSLRFWPLLLVLAGFAILLIGRTTGSPAASGGPRGGEEEHD